jgi:hypothetical protein
VKARKTCSTRRNLVLAQSDVQHSAYGFQVRLLHAHIARHAGCAAKQNLSRKADLLEGCLDGLNLRPQESSESPMEAPLRLLEELTSWLGTTMVDRAQSRDSGAGL